MGNDLQKLRELTERLPMLGYKKPESPLKVLVMEDEKSINRLIIETLEYFGCECTSATNSKEAFELIKVKEFDVLLANIIVKEKGEGTEMIHSFQDKFPHAIVIIMSSDEDRLYSYSKYFATLAMPFGIYDLVKKVSNGVAGRTK
jgi:DNA-binding NtrC family response regulator